MFLILSARTVSEDIALNYGRLPPSFLPLGNQRLFELQKELAGTDSVAMTVPDGFAIATIDKQAIEALGIRLLPQPSSLSLTDAIKAAVQELNPQEPLRILYGDTLVRLDQTPSECLAEDRVVFQRTTANYPWAYVLENHEGDRFSDDPPHRLDTRKVICGDFTFMDCDLLVQACDAGGIIDLLNTYNQTRKFSLVEATEWLDFGHLPLYFQSKKSVMIKRVFNRLDYENHLLIKQSEDTGKIRSEAHWYESLPGDLCLHTPRYRGRVERDHLAGYALEYLYLPLLSDLAAFGALPLSSWLEILNASFEFLDKCQAISPDPGAPEAAPTFAERFFQDMIVEKTRERLTAYGDLECVDLHHGFTLNGKVFPPILQLVDDLISCIPPTSADHIRFWHGDLFYGNMFYDFTARRVLAIDPRGQLGNGQACIFGDWRYDLAKLAHSVVGQYDAILLGRSQLIEHDPRNWSLHISSQPHQDAMEQIFMTQMEDRYRVTPDELTAMTALLFFSMLPLHRDRPDLQRQMLANGLRLAAKVEGAMR